MRSRLLSVIGVGAFAAAPLASLSAQGLSSSKCASGITQDACQQASDVYQLIAPQLGLALTGGNATAGQGGVLGGLGHVSVGVRINAFGGLIPNTSNDGYAVSLTGAQQRTLPTKSSAFGLPTADAAVGLYKGFPLPLTNILGVDALVSAEYVPTINGDSGDFSLKPSTNLRFGYGVRIGLLSESIAFPGVAFTWIERDLPTIGVTASANSSGEATQLDISNMVVKTHAWRIVASKSLIAFNVAAGVGRDGYNQSATIQGTVNGVTSTPVQLAQPMNRTNMFADLGINMPVLKIVFEVGEAIGGSVQTFNSFSGGSPDRSQVYGSFGVRLSR